jgi:phospholipid/cholesterol/gamma-HCH transport system substrate-binding protein
MSRDSAAARRVGLLVLIAVAVGAGALLVLGEHQNLFARKNLYRIHFENVSGLAQGSAVKLNGVDVGSVARIVLPTQLGENQLDVWIKVDARYGARIRDDSEARIKTLGLLGDKYIDLSSGSPSGTIIPPGGDIPTAPPTDIDRLAEAGEDVVNSLAALARQLSDILGRMEKGEGLLGKLLMDKEAGDRMSNELEGTLTSLQTLARGLNDRGGTVGRLLHDRELGDRFAHTIDGADSLVTKLDQGDGLLPALLRDPAYKQRFGDSLDHLDQVVTRLGSLTDRLENGDGLIPKLISDDAYGRQMATELQTLVTNLRQIAEKLNKGDGSAAQLINDPTLVQAIDDVVLGIENSKAIKWLIQNRRKHGEKMRREAGENQPPGSGPADGGAEPKD